jgi:hypothetical protein
MLASRQIGVDQQNRTIQPYEETSAEYAYRGNSGTVRGTQKQKGENKRPSSPSSESSASVSKKARPASNSNDPLHLRLSSQKDFEQDTLLEVVHNMLSFQVIIFII